MTTQPSPAPASNGFRRGIAITSFGTLITIGLFFIETIISAWLLAPAAYGTYVLLVSLVNFLVLAIDFGCQTGMTQLLASSDRDRQEALANSAIMFRLLCCAGLAVVIWASQPLLAPLDPARTWLPYTFYIPLMLAGASLDELLLGILRGFQLYQPWTLVQIVRSLLRVLLSTVLITVFKLDVLGLILSWTISFGVAVLIEYSALPIPRRLMLRRPLLREMLRFGFSIQLSRFLWFAFLQADVLLLGALAGPAAAAFYTVARRIPDGFQRLADSYIAVYFPEVTALLAQGQREAATQLMNRSLKLFSFLIGVVALGSVVFSREIMLIFSHKYVDSAPAFALLMLGLHITFVLSIKGYTLTAAGHPSRTLVENATRTGLNVVGDIALIPVMGFVGPAVATLFAGYIANGVIIWMLRRSNILVDVLPYLTQVLLLLACSAAGYWLHSYSLLYGMVMLGVFIGANLLLKTVSLDDLSLVIPERYLRIGRVAVAPVSGD